MRIAILSPIKLEVYGGRENWIIGIGNKLVELGYCVYVFSPNWVGYKGKERLDENKLKKIIKFKYFRILPLIKFKSFYEVLFRSNSFDIIYAADFIGFKILPFKVRNNQILILGNHSFFKEQKGKSIFIKKQYIKIASKILRKKENIKIHVINSWQFNFYGALGFKNIYLIPNFVNSRYYFYPQKINEFTVLFMARFSKEKGIDFLPKIIEKVLEKNKEIKFWICGSGNPYYENLIKRLEKKYSENVKYFGFVSEEKKRELLARANLLLIPSRFEGQPIAVLEVLVSGCPFLGSNIIAFRDLINLYDKNFGWIVKEYTPEAFAKKILEIYQKWKEDPDEYFERRKYIAEKARELFDIEKIVKEFEEKLLK